MTLVRAEAARSIRSAAVRTNSCVMFDEYIRKEWT